MNVVKVVQCRDNSTRFKNKSVRPFHKDKSILELILARLKNNGFRKIYVLTSEKSPMTIEQAKKSKVEVFIGDEDNVLSRYQGFCDKYKPDGLIRICADNPFFSTRLMYMPFNHGRSGQYDYVSWKNAMIRHEGLFSEYVSETAIMELNNKDLSFYDKEHVTSYIYNHPDEFRVFELAVPEVMDEIPVRLTVDTKDDFKIAQKLYRVIKEKDWFHLYAFLYKQPRLLELMMSNMENNKKNE